MLFAPQNIYLSFNIDAKKVRKKNFDGPMHSNDYIFFICTKLYYTRDWIEQ